MFDQQKYICIGCRTRLPVVDFTSEGDYDSSHFHVVQPSLSLIGLGSSTAHWVWSVIKIINLLIFREHIIQENRFELGCIGSQIHCINEFQINI